MPGNVKEFLRHVHAEKGKFYSNDAQIDEQINVDDVDEQLFYYDAADELNVIPTESNKNSWEKRHLKIYDKHEYLFNHIIDFPIGAHSLNWFLVTNNNIGKNLKCLFLIS